MDKYQGQEELLYDMISECGVESVLAGTNTDIQGATPVPSAPAGSSTMISINDFIEIGQLKNGARQPIQDDCLIVKVSNITTHGDSSHIDILLQPKAPTLSDVSSRPDDKKGPVRRQGLCRVESSWCKNCFRQTFWDGLVHMQQRLRRSFAACNTTQIRMGKGIQRW